MPSLEAPSLFSNSLKAKLPIISATTDDLINFAAAIQLLSGRKVAKYTQLKNVTFSPGVVYYTCDETFKPTPELYKQLLGSESTLVLINPKEDHSLVFKAGELPVPQKFVHDYLSPFIASDCIEAVEKELKGLSLKASSEVMQLTMVKHGNVSAKAVRETRSSIRGEVQGLIPESTELDFYVSPKELKDWSAQNKEFFFGDWPSFMIPRGLFLTGVRGRGKTIGARAICKEWGIPLFRLSISGLLNKFIGVSEQRMESFLSALDQEEPCGLLIDECEKLFHGDSEGTSNRQLAMLLWWLEEHTSKVLTFATSNNIKAVPPEFYRPGRFDKVVTFGPLSLEESYDFASQWLEKRTSVLWHTVYAQVKSEVGKLDLLTEASVNQAMVSLSKKYGWVKKNNL
jgi:hypothetical protein